MGSPNNTLGIVNEAVTLAVNLGQVLVPAISGIIKDIKSKQNPDGTIEYTLAITTGQENLDTAKANFQSSLDFINAELQKQGQPLMEVPASVQTLHNPEPVENTAVGSINTTSVATGGDTK